MLSGIRHPELDRLISLFQSLESGADEEVGLLLNSELARSGYDATPANALTFARTGGDGVHFSFLASEYRDPSLWPVVMTVPMEFDHPNYVVGTDLTEFLGLGLKVGYFVLEGLAYDYQVMITELNVLDYPCEASPIMISTLEAIGQEFSVEAWSDPESRLQELARMYPLA
jgi:hypothetical protein